MLTTLSPHDMKRIEQRVFAETSITGEALMQNAAAHVAAAVSARIKARSGPIIALCGTGNNGGDALAALRMLCADHPTRSAQAWLLDGPLSPDCQRELELLQEEAPGVVVHVLSPNSAELTDGAATDEVATDGTPLEKQLLESAPACLIDGLFGTGLSRPLEGAALALCHAVNAFAAQGTADKDTPVIAVDIPSGLNGETGQVLGGALHATETITFHRPKTGLYVGQGPAYTGKITLCDIGIPPVWDDAPGYAIAQPSDMAGFFPPRSPLTHKGHYGRVLVIAGSLGMAGAAALCALAALRTGAGLVTVACPKAILATVQGLCPCATCIPLSDDMEAAWATLTSALDAADSLAIGPGLGQSPFALDLMDRLLSHIQEKNIPAVLDADGLNLLSQLAFRNYTFTSRQCLTPHPAEAARLLALSTAEVVEAAPEAAARLQAQFGTSVVLKGSVSLLLSGLEQGLNVLGTPALAKGGSGDVLTGVLAALLAAQAQGTLPLSGLSLLQAGCALHGLAGQRAEKKHGQRGVLATDVLMELGMDF